MDLAGKATGTAPGSVQITATDAAAGISAQASLTVGLGQLVSLDITPASRSVPSGLTQAFVVTGTYSDKSTLDLTDAATWSSSNTTVATIASTGTASTLRTGQTTITATVGPKKATATLTVTSAVIASVAVTPAAPSLPLGTVQQFAATGTYTDQTTQDLTSVVTWTSSSPAAFISNAAGSNGLVTTAATGTTTITATYASANLSGSTTLIVTAPALVSIAITPPSPSVPVGLTQAFAATGTYTDGTTQDVTQTVTWSSSAANLFAVSNAAGSSGLGTALTVGTATVSAKDSATGVSGTTPVTVTPAVLTSIALSAAAAGLPLGATEQLTARGTYSDASTRDVTAVVTWSSASGAATVSNAAGTSGLVAATALGTATITAIDPTTSLSASTDLTVTAAALVSIAVTPVTQSVPDGLTQQFAAKPAARTILAAPTWCVRTVTHILAATFARAASQASPAARAPTAPAAATKA